jgi:hypothetical protein
VSGYEYDDPDEYSDSYELSDNSEYNAPETGRWANAGSAPDEMSVVARYTGSYPSEALTPERMTEESDMQWQRDWEEENLTPESRLHEEVTNATERYETERHLQHEAVLDNAAAAYNLPREAIEEAVPIAIEEGIRQFMQNGGTLADAQRAFAEQGDLYWRTAVNDAAEALNEQVISETAMRMSGLKR